MNYKKLKLKIKELFDTQEAFAKAMEMSQTALNQRLNGAVEWKSSEIAKACGVSVSTVERQLNPTDYT